MKISTTDLMLKASMALHCGYNETYFARTLGMDQADASFYGSVSPEVVAELCRRYNELVGLTQELAEYEGQGYGGYGKGWADAKASVAEEASDLIKSFEADQRPLESDSPSGQAGAFEKMIPRVVEEFVKAHRYLCGGDPSLSDGAISDLAEAACRKVLLEASFGAGLQTNDPPRPQCALHPSANVPSRPRAPCW